MFDIRDSSVIRELMEEGLKKGLEQGEELGRMRGEIEGMQKSILALIVRRFGTVTPQLQAKIKSQLDLSRLEALFNSAIDIDDPDRLLVD